MIHTDPLHHEGLACFHRAHPDLVVLDMYMSDRDGLETILLLRISDQAVKILAVSGDAIEGYDACQSVKAFGAQDAPVKPFSSRGFENAWSGF